MSAHDNILASAARALLEGRLDDPFALLGPHGDGEQRIVRSFQPGAVAVSVAPADGKQAPVALEESADGVFVGTTGSEGPYLLRIEWPGGHVQETEDPYSFGLILGELDLHLFAEGRHLELGRVFGAHPRIIDGITGVAFSVWAPNARRVSVVGDFNNWDGRRHPMRLRHGSGVWELFVPRLGPGARYKFEVAGADGSIVQKADPMARQTEPPPATGSIVAAEPDYRWTDQDWIEERARRHAPDAPISTYEVHAGSWMKAEGDTNRTLDWQGLTERLIPYVADMGFTHIEFLPVSEHPYDPSWGYQTTGLFAPSARFGGPDGFARFVDGAHRAGISVLIDWVPAHFPVDEHGLALFDGTALYEHADPKLGFHPDWNTAIYNFGRREVASFLVNNALFWAERYHVDGLRVDAVASMLYRDYSREDGEWIPNEQGGRENWEAVALLRAMNRALYASHAGIITVAEESTSWPGVSQPAYDDAPGSTALGFGFKWNMGFMHDTLQYMARDPIHRQFHHDEITFGLVYAFSENFVLPLSHDEVVHGKGSLLAKMSGDDWQKFANLRAYYGLMWGYPGKKLLFMGQEFAQRREWSEERALDWDLRVSPMHEGVRNLVRDLNHLHAAKPALHARDCEGEGFEWLIADDRQNSVFAWLRKAPGARSIAVISNMTPALHDHYRVPLPHDGKWREILNSDSQLYGGSGQGNLGAVTAVNGGASLVLPPLATIMLEWDG